MYLTNKKIKNKRTVSKKLLIASLIILAVLAVLAIVFLLVRNSSDDPSMNDQTDSLNSTEADEKVTNPAPPTESEANSGDNVPQKSENTTGEEPSPASETVEVLISNAGVYDGKVEINAFTTTVLRNGTCRITFVGEQTNTNVEKSTQARADATTTICIDNPFPVSELSSDDDWAVTVEYVSEDSSYSGEGKTRISIQ